MWRLSGIDRDVYLYASSLVTIRNILINTSLDQDYKNGSLTSSVWIRNYSDQAFAATLTCELISRATNKIIVAEKKELSMKPDDMKEILFRKDIPSPALWSAENPELYDLAVAGRFHNLIYRSAIILFKKCYFYTYMGSFIHCSSRR